MKRNRLFMTLILAIVVFLSENMIANADTIGTASSSVNKDGNRELIVCDYQSSDGPIYVQSLNNGSVVSAKMRSFQVRYRLQKEENGGNDLDNWYLYRISTNNNDSSKIYDVEISHGKNFTGDNNDKKVNYQKDKSYLDANNLLNFGASYEEGGVECTKFFNINKDSKYPCLTDREWCEEGHYFNEANKNFFSFPLGQSSIFNEIQSFAVSIFNSNTLRCEDKNSSGFNTIIKENIKDKFKEKYSGFAIPTFVNNYIMKDTVLGVEKVQSSWNDFSKKCDDQKEKEITDQKNENENLVQNGEISQEECDERNNALDNELKDYKDASKAAEQNRTSYMTPVIDISGQIRDDKSCDSVLGGKMSKAVTNIFRTIQYAGPILVFLLTVIDFVKAVASGSQEDMKKATTRLGKRIVFAILLFFIPLICDFLLKTTGIIPKDITLCTFD